MAIGRLGHDSHLHVSSLQLHIKLYSVHLRQLELNYWGLGLRKALQLSVDSTSIRTTILPLEEPICIFLGRKQQMILIPITRIV